MLLPVNPHDLLPFFWRVPAHTTRRVNAAQTLFTFASDAGDDPALRNTVSRAISRGSAPAAEVIGRLVDHLARNSGLQRSETDQIREIVDADLKAIASEPLPSTTWPIALNAWAKYLSFPGPASPELISFFAQLNDYADRSERLRRVLFAGNIDAIRQEVDDLPFGETQTLMFIQRRLAGLNDPIIAGHVLGLLFPLTMMDLVGRFASYSDDDMFRFLPRRCAQTDRVERPMWLFMGTVQRLLDLPTEELTNRALLSDDL